MSLRNSFRSGFDMIQARHEPMGFIHTLYYLQVLQAQEDAKREEEEARKEFIKNRSKKKSAPVGPSSGDILANRRMADALAEEMELL